jgi:hypothetical protein
MTNRLPPRLETRLIRAIPAECPIAPHVRTRIARFVAGPEVSQRPKDAQLGVALLWSADCECEIVPDGSDAWIIVDVSLLQLLALSNHLFLGTVEPATVIESIRERIAHACLLKGEWSLAIHLAKGASHRFDIYGQSCVAQTMLEMQIDYIIRHELYHYRIKTDPDFAQRSLEDYAERVVPVLAGFFPLPRFLGQPLRDKIGVEAVSRLRDTENHRTRESLKWSLNRVEEEICDFWALSDLFSEHPEHAAVTLTTPVTVAMALAVREEIVAAATIAQNRTKYSVELNLLDGDPQQIDFNPRYEARVINASMRSATVAALADRMDEIHGLNETSFRYSSAGIYPIREAVDSVRKSIKECSEKRGLVVRNDHNEQTRALILYGFPIEPEVCDIELYYSPASVNRDVSMLADRTPD